MSMRKYQSVGRLPYRSESCISLQTRDAQQGVRPELDGQEPNGFEANLEVELSWPVVPN